MKDDYIKRTVQDIRSASEDTAITRFTIASQSQAVNSLRDAQIRIAGVAAMAGVDLKIIKELAEEIDMMLKEIE